MRARSVVSIGSLVLALFIAPTAASGKDKTGGRPTSRSQGFWYGEIVPQAQADVIHRMLTTPDPQNPLGQSAMRQLINALRADSNYPGHSGVWKIDETRMEPGYTLLSSLTGGAHLIDARGNEVKSWNLNAFPAKMLPGGSVLGLGVTGNTTVNAIHMDSASLVQQGWCGDEEWKWSGKPGAVGGARVHHDFQREGNPVGYPAPGASAVDGHAGRTWLLVHSEPGIVTSVSPKIGLEDDGVVEIDKDGTVTWEWYASDHIEQMGFDTTARAAIATQKVVNLVDSLNETDWQHINNINQLGPNKWYEAGDERFHPENIIMDGRTTNLIWIVARYDHPLGSWKAGDIVWRTGPNYGYGNPEYQIGQIIGQHTAHMIPAGLPGAGNILVFDNGGIAGYGSLLPGAPPFWPVAYRNYSRAVEYDPVTYEKVWEYTQEIDESATGGDRRFFSWFISSVQRLKNGNTLIMQGNAGRAIEVTPAGEVVWEYVSPWPKDGVANMTYRAYRYPESYLPKDRTCPTTP